MRAFRPSHFSISEEDSDEETQRAKDMNLQVYAARVRAGLPLFEAGPVSVPAKPQVRPGMAGS